MLQVEFRRDGHLIDFLSVDETDLPAHYYTMPSMHLHLAGIAISEQIEKIVKSEKEPTNEK